ncbi:MAG TPA: tail fiber protein [Candidatus Dormibacteraeota bacterium]|nr:tail fiber protein [Candidatus Dormibacteraeota bacterium]
MSEPYVGEIRLVGFNFAPQGWAFCDGSLLSISQYDTLFNLIGTTYGGDGQSTFGLPDLRSRVPVHMGTNPSTGTSYALGQMSGSEAVTLTAAQIVGHAHTPQATVAGSQPSPANNFWAGATPMQYLTPVATTGQMNAGAVLAAGGSQPHDNMLPFLVINFVISLFGVYPSQT